ncbi:nucleotidyltransferase substrate binding protein [Candidatus Halobeggiatoa sp. HSG11]|nr:nucleotidyltransferase substrate binding protein [Candidatus Halobeggiatoa sp. HSG11]
MTINIDYFNRCIQTLESAFDQLQLVNQNDIIFDIYRSACVKEFEIILEQSGKLLKKRLREYFSSNKAIDRITFKDTFRYAAKHTLIDIDACERWLEYRDNRNNTAHDYGEQFAEITLKLLPNFITDAKALAKIIENG